MDVNKEIERKFLLRRFPKIEGDYTEYKIKQWYTPDGLRYRFQVDTNTNDVSIYKTKKSNISKGVFQEDEEPISLKEFLEIDLSKARILEKIRTVVKHKGFDFEIDEFKDYDLITLEVELDDINEKIPFPENIKKEIVKELTGLKEFSNFALSK